MSGKLTEQDIQKIQDEIEHRKRVVRKEALDALKEARAQGDLSENFEYYAAKRDKNKNESRIRYLERMLKTAEVVRDDSGSDEAGLNDSVTVWFEEDEEEETFKLVTSIRGSSVEGRISTESPFGRALLGHKEGERVFVPVNHSGYYVTIRKIRKSSDENDEIKAF